MVAGKIGDKLRMDYTTLALRPISPRAFKGSPNPARSASAYRPSAPHCPISSSRALGRRALKGMAERVPVYEPQRVRSGGGDIQNELSGVGSVLVGRDRELSILLQSVEPLTAVEPGVGKSRLVAEARRRSAAKGVLWL